MTKPNQNQEPTSLFPKLDRVARNQRRLTRLNTFVTFLFLTGAIAGSVSALAACGQEATIGADSQDLQAAVDALNANDTGAIDGTFGREAKAQLSQLRSAVGSERIRYVLRDVSDAEIGVRAMLDVIPEGAAEAAFTVAITMSRGDRPIVRELKISLDHAPAE